MLPEDDCLRIYRETIRPLYAYAAKRAGGDRQLAEDVTQEAWLRAIDAWRKRGAPGEPLAWLKTTTRNLLINHFRRRRPPQVSPSELDLRQESLEPESPSAAALLLWGLSRLREGEARLFEAHHIEGEALASLAREYGISERAVEGRLRRARLALRDALTPHFSSSIGGRS